MKSKLILPALAALFGFTAPYARAEALKVLAIGNSFSVCTQHQLPQVAKNLGCPLDLVTMTIGGCSLERHWNCLTNAADLTYSLQWNRSGVAFGAWPELKACQKSALRRDRKTGKDRPAKGANLADVLKAAKWDVITIQQASHFSWQPATYHPWGDNLVREIRARVPKAKILVQETWSYTPWDKRLAKWKISPAEMYAQLHKAYADFAAGYGFEVIPTGTAVEAWRRRLPVRYAPDSFGGDVCGSARFEPLPAGGFAPKGDVFHFNARGNYLQALVWAGTLFKTDVTRGTYAPGCVTEAEARLMREIAREVTKKQGTER